DAARGTGPLAGKVPSAAGALLPGRPDAVRSGAATGLGRERPARPARPGARAVTATASAPRRHSVGGPARGGGDPQRSGFGGAGAHGNCAPPASGRGGSAAHLPT